MTPQSVTPNLFELAGKDGSSITYSTTSNRGKAHLVYMHNEIEEFWATDIRQLDTEIGQQVTVTLKRVAKQSITTLTLLLPSFRLGEGGVASFKTMAIITNKHAGPKAVVVEGAQQAYRIEELNGTAKFVYF